VEVPFVADSVVSALSPADELELCSVARSLLSLGFADVFADVDFVAFFAGLTAGLLGGVTTAVLELGDSSGSDEESEDSEASLVKLALSEGDGLLTTLDADGVPRGGIVTPVDDIASGGFSVGICVILIGFF